MDCDWRQFLSLHEEWSEMRTLSEIKISYREYKSLLDSIASSIPASEEYIPTFEGFMEDALLAIDDLENTGR